AFRRQAERRHHLVVDDEIRRADIYVSFGLIDDVQIDVFTKNLPVKRRVAERLDKSAALESFRVINMGKIRFMLQRILYPADNTPHVKKHNSHTPDSFSFQHNRSILPVPESFFLIDIFVRKIDPSGESGISVNDADFPVVSVILDNIQHRTEGIEDPALDPLLS